MNASQPLDGRLQDSRRRPVLALGISFAAIMLMVAALAAISIVTKWWPELSLIPALSALFVFLAAGLGLIGVDQGWRAGLTAALAMVGFYLADPVWWAIKSAAEGEPFTIESAEWILAIVWMIFFYSFWSGLYGWALVAILVVAIWFARKVMPAPVRTPSLFGTRVAQDEQFEDQVN